MAAATAVDAGWQVVMPAGHACCGRPLHDYGFLDTAKRYLHHVLDALREDIRAGTPVVGMEPSCLAVFRDELAGMLPHDDDAKRLARNVYHFGEFLQEFDVEVPRFAREALLWGHCHHRATGGVEPEQHVLERMGVTTDPVSGGCRGVAGAWGYEQGNHGISVGCGEQVRAAQGDTVVVADGFSCRTQIEQVSGGRRALHLAQVLQLAREGYRGEGRPEEAYGHRRPRPGPRRRARRLAGLGAAAAGLVAPGAARRR